MSEITEIQEEIMDEFSMFDDWMDRYDLLIEQSKSLPVIDTKHKNNDHIIEGCQSRVWLHADYKNGAVQFTADSDAIITKGIVALLIRVLSGQEPKAIMEAELEFIDSIGLRENLSPTRSNGLLAMIKQMKLYAMAFDAKNKS